jgi:Heterokaryon incompatibility protein (HET)
MWLLDTTTSQLRKFSGTNTPPYAILSHRWGPEEEEVSFQDISESLSQLQDQKMKIKGFEKIKKTCELARSPEHSLKYAWVDTCNIDKSNSTELSEAINSMFRWYLQSAVCFVFLDDLDPESVSLSECKWFTRGWTLQELIAPRRAIFFNKSWTRLGDKMELGPQIAQITGIQVEVLNGDLPLENVPVAVRMSWAAGRETTRPEDMAYCLLGLFDVHMAMLYGEGDKAFLRLQEEIIKVSIDMSIFAWTALPGHPQKYTGLLAQSPAQFRNAQNLTPQQHTLFDVREFSITNRGIRFNIPAFWNSEQGYYILPVFHSQPNKENFYSQGIYLRKVGRDLYARALPDQLASMPDRGSNATLQIVKTLSVYQSEAIAENVLEILTPKNLYSPDFGLSKVKRMESLDTGRRHLFAGHTGAFLGYLKFEPEWADEFESFVLVCGFDRSRAPVERWRFHLVRGDHWETEIRSRFDDRHNFAREFLRGSQTLAIPHLNEKGRQKVIEVRCANHSPKYGVHIRVTN